MAKKSFDARGSAPAPAMTAGRPRARRARAAPLSEAQLVDIDRVADLASKWGWFGFQMHGCKVSLPFAQPHRGRREAARRSPAPSSAPPAPTAAAPNAKQRRSARRLQDYQEAKRRERVGGAADADGDLAAVRRQDLVEGLVILRTAPRARQPHRPHRHGVPPLLSKMLSFAPGVAHLLSAPTEWRRNLRHSGSGDAAGTCDAGGRTHRRRGQRAPEGRAQRSSCACRSQKPARCAREMRAKPVSAFRARNAGEARAKRMRDACEMRARSARKASRPEAGDRLVG